MNHTMRTSCLGPEGSFSERAATELCGGEIVLAKSFHEAVSMLLAGEVDRAVLPVENSLGGGVLPVLDLLAASPVFGEAEKVLPIDHRLALLKGVEKGDIRTICSHEQAFAQCGEYLRVNFPDARLVSAPSTAASLQMLDGHTAAIVGSHIVRENVLLSENNIADNKQNFTRFLRVRRGSGEQAACGTVFVCAVCAHRPGALYGLLKIFDRHALNLTHIESRPVKGRVGEYRFFIEFAGDLRSKKVQKAIVEAENYCTEFKLLGGYGEPR